MPDNPPLKIRTMADDLEKARKGEISFTSPVSGTPDILTPLKVRKKLPSQAADFGGREKKSLKDVLVQLGEGGNNLESPKAGGDEKLKGEIKEEIRKEAGEEIEKEDKSELKDLLGKMENLAQKRPPSLYSVPTPSRPPQENKQEDKREEGKIEIGKEPPLAPPWQGGEKEEIQFQKLPGESEESREPKEVDPIKEKMGEKVSPLTGAGAGENRKSETIRNIKEEMSLLRDQEETKGDIMEIEKKLAEKKREFEDIKERKKRREAGGMEESRTVTFGGREERVETKRDALKEIEEKAAEEAERDSETPYLSPGARLLYNKPEHYSSALNKVKEKRESPEISKIKKTLKDQEPPKKEKKKDPDQEYRQFKKSLKSKYGAGLARKTNKRITLGLAGLAIIGIAGTLVWFFILNKPQPAPPTAPTLPAATVSGIEEFSSISDEIVINLGKGESVGLAAKINAQAARLEREGKTANISRVAVKKEGAAIPLKELLEELKIEMPAGALDSFDNNRYNLLLFKERSGAKRLGLVMAADSPSTTRLKFQNWENEKIASRKMYRAFEPLFLGSRISSASQEGFKTGEYLGVKMRYLQIPDKDTSLDYLIYGDILAVTTSKDSIFQVIEILISS